MAENVYLIRCAPYEYILPGMDLYESFDAVATGNYDPQIKPGFRMAVGDDIVDYTVLYAPDTRCKQTAKLISENAQPLQQLREVGYNMSQVISRFDFIGADGHPNVQRARQGFMDALVNNRLSENYRDVAERAESLINYAADVECRNVIMVSHAFFMKFVEVYLKDNGLLNDPHVLQRYFDTSHEAYGFCGGFKARTEYGIFRFDSYITQLGHQINL
ncbi:MAG: phosphoglycerate mutase family protein [Candidatus Micrarchaeota archaeon]|nr:phosphoglycerate mutase family protein [Candidatus Micrarchaeota archaeon]